MTTDTASGHFEDVVGNLRRVHATGRTRGIDWRLRQLDGIGRLVAEREQEIASALKADLGRSAVEALLGDITSTRGEVDFARKRLRRWMRPKRQRIPLNQLPGSAWVQYESLGVVLVIGLWSYPVYLTLSPLVAAVAAVNCAVVKPSELAPATSALLALHILPYSATVLVALR